MGESLSYEQDDTRHGFRIGLFTAVFSAVLGLGIAYILLMTQPELSRSARDMIAQRVGPNMAGWLVPVAIAGIAMGAAGLGVSLLSGLVRGVRQQPFLLLAPMLCTVTISVLVSMPAAPQLGIMGARGFAIPALLLALGGATLFQLGPWLAKLAGLVVWLAPALLLAGGSLTHHPTFAADVLLAQAGQPLAMLVGFCWTGLGLLGWVAPDVRDAVPLAEARAAVQGLRTRLLDAERRIGLVASQGPDGQAISHLQARLCQAEQALQQVDQLRWSLQHARERADRMEADALARGGAPGLLWSTGIGLGAVMVTVAVGYVGWLRPLRSEIQIAASKAEARTPGPEGHEALEELRRQRVQLTAALARHEEEAAEKMSAVVQQSSERMAAHEATIAALRGKLGLKGEPSAHFIHPLVSAQDARSSSGRRPSLPGSASSMSGPDVSRGAAVVRPKRAPAAVRKLPTNVSEKPAEVGSAGAGTKRVAGLGRRSLSRRRPDKRSKTPAASAKSASPVRRTKPTPQRDGYRELLEAPAKKASGRKGVRNDLAEFLDDDPIGGL